MEMLLQTSMILIQSFSTSYLRILAESDNRAFLAFSLSFCQTPLQAQSKVS